MAGELTLTTTLARPALPVLDTPQLVYLLLEATPTQAVSHVQVAVNVGFVLDHSGSMKGEKIHRVREAVQLAIGMMGPEDTISVVIFDHRVETFIPSQQVLDQGALIRKIGEIREAGGTKIAPALKRALDEVSKAKHKGITRLILLTDGQTEKEKDCIIGADEAGRLGIPVTTLGVGDDWNEDLLIEMANRALSGRWCR